MADTAARASRVERPVPLVAIVGRPNVGKSTLFNRIVGSRTAIVEDRARTTRDRLYGDAEWNGRRFVLIDTGGLEVDTNDPIELRVQEQARLAISEADVDRLRRRRGHRHDPGRPRGGRAAPSRTGAGHRGRQQGRQREARARGGRVPRHGLGRDVSRLGVARAGHRRPARRDRLVAPAGERTGARSQGARGRGRCVDGRSRCRAARAVRRRRSRGGPRRGWRGHRRDGARVSGDRPLGRGHRGRGRHRARRHRVRRASERRQVEPAQRAAGRGAGDRLRRCRGRPATRSTHGWRGVAARSC